MDHLHSYVVNKNISNNGILLGLLHTTEKRFESFFCAVHIVLRIFNLLLATVHGAP